MKRIRSLIRNRSLVQLVQLIGINLAFPFRILNPKWHAARARDQEFDKIWGTDTSGNTKLSALELSPELVRHGVRYQAGASNLLPNALSELNIDLSQYSFLDYGAGKGRMVLSASLFPFREVIGIEMSHELVDVANNNLELFQEKSEKGESTSFICCDAASFDLPAGNLVCFFYNPFDETIMSKVASKLESAVNENGCSIVIIYQDPRCRHVFESTTIWQIVTNDAFLILTSRASS